MYIYCITYFAEDGSCNQKILSADSVFTVVKYLKAIGIVNIDSIVRKVGV